MQYVICVERPPESPQTQTQPSAATGAATPPTAGPPQMAGATPLRAGGEGEGPRAGAGGMTPAGTGGRAGAGTVTPAETAAGAAPTPEAPHTGAAMLCYR